MEGRNASVEMREALRVVLVSTPDEMEHVMAIRRAVFTEEQGVPEDEEIDSYDAEAPGPRTIYILGYRGTEPVATGRLLLDPSAGEFPHVGRVAVLKEHRGKGYGSAIMAAFHSEAKMRNFVGITLAAQLHAVDFYEALGYVARGEVFLDAGIEHRWMDLRFR